MTHLGGTTGPMAQVHNAESRPLTDQPETAEASRRTNGARPCPRHVSKFRSTSDAIAALEGRSVCYIAMALWYAVGACGAW
jgi:hypothetical protein